MKIGRISIGRLESGAWRVQDIDGAWQIKTKQREDGKYAVQLYNDNGIYIRDLGTLKDGSVRDSATLNIAIKRAVEDYARDLDMINKCTEPYSTRLFFRLKEKFSFCVGTPFTG